MALMALNSINLIKFKSTWDNNNTQLANCIAFKDLDWMHSADENDTLQVYQCLIDFG